MQTISDHAHQIVAALRAAADEVSLNQIGRETGLAASTIERIVNGKHRMPAVETLERCERWLRRRRR